MSDEDSSTGGSGSPGEPGGGPERIVSEQSVDDILNSLNETKSSEADDTATGQTETESSTKTSNTDSPPKTAGIESASDGDTTDPDDDADSQDRSADLADRIEQGTVTGADVRAAETGEDREPTPEIDEVDLSMDDLEASTTGSSPTPDTDDLDEDAGPLAGSIDPQESTTADADTATESDGFFGRLKRLFSR